MRIDKIPQELRDLRSWVLWKTVIRKEGDKPTKIPFQTNGAPASSSDPKTWSSLAEVMEVYERGQHCGIGFEFSKDDPYCGIDLDGCRDRGTGDITEWAKEIIRSMATYSEISPSQTGVKLFCRAKSPFENGKKKEVKEVEHIGDKTPAIEIYDWGRYFAVTGLRLGGLSETCEPRQNELEELIEKYFPNETPQAAKFDFRSTEAIFQRAKRYVAKMPPAVSGQDGHGQTYRVACVLVLGFELTQEESLALMHEYNQTCQPPWSEKELLHKLRSANKETSQRGYLKTTRPDRWSDIRIPQYEEPATEVGPRETTLHGALQEYAENLKNGHNNLITMGVPELDYAIGGGVEKGEMIVIAARPSHGKSAVGLQCIHQWTKEGRPCAIVSEEMAALALGKRTLQYISDIPQEHWVDLMPSVESQIEQYGQNHAKCVVLEGCGTADAARKSIERVVQEDGVQCVVVDYAQLLGADGKDRYQQMTRMSVTLRQLASSQKIVLIALCQMNRSIESRSEFRPVLSDIKETGQLEQDADVIMFLCWPYRLNTMEPPGKYQFFIAKNRNREINQHMVVCKFIPSRQQIIESTVQESRHEYAT